VDNTRDVEGAHGRKDEEVGVVERAESWRLRSAFGVVPDIIIIIINIAGVTIMRTMRIMRDIII